VGPHEIVGYGCAGAQQGGQLRGYDTRTQRIVKENAAQLGFEAHEFEN